MSPQPGEEYSLTLGTGEEVSGRVWHKTNHQVGLTVHSYAEHGEGLLIVADQPVIADKRPDGGSLVILSLYDLGAASMETIRSLGTTGALRTTPHQNPSSEGSARC
jgi:hypothetical protein